MRRLGVLLDRITVQDAGDEREIALDDPALREGWYGAEYPSGRLVRWTDGDAYVPLKSQSTCALVRLRLLAAMPAGADQKALELRAS